MAWFLFACDRNSAVWPSRFGGHPEPLVPRYDFLVDQCAHWVQWDQAERLNRLVADFLKS